MSPAFPLLCQEDDRSKTGGISTRLPFVQPPPFEFGNAQRYLSDVRSPGTLNWDMLAARGIPIREPFSLDFRMEFFNAFNHVQFAAPNTSVSSSSFGQIFLSQANTPRELQAGLRLSF
jgi:hypothetical protein